MRAAVLLMVAVLLVGDVGRVGGDEGNTARNVPIPVPEDAGIDDATFQRLAGRYADEKQSFLKLLLADTSDRGQTTGLPTRCPI